MSASLQNPAVKQGESTGLARIKARLLRLADVNGPNIIWPERAYQCLPAIKTGFSEANFSSVAITDPNKKTQSAVVTSPSKQNARGLSLKFQRNRGRTETNAAEDQPADGTAVPAAQQQPEADQQPPELEHAAQEATVAQQQQQAQVQLQGAQIEVHASGLSSPQQQAGGSSSGESGARSGSQEPEGQRVSTGSSNQGLGSPSESQQEDQQLQGTQSQSPAEVAQAQAGETPRSTAQHLSSAAGAAGRGSADLANNRLVQLQDQLPMSQESDGPPLFIDQDQAGPTSQDGHNQSRQAEQRENGQSGLATQDADASYHDNRQSRTAAARGSHSPSAPARQVMPSALGAAATASTPVRDKAAHRAMEVIDITSPPLFVREVIDVTSPPTSGVKRRDGVKEDDGATVAGQAVPAAGGTPQQPAASADHQQMAATEEGQLATGSAGTGTGHAATTGPAAPSVQEPQQSAGRHRSSEAQVLAADVAQSSPPALASQDNFVALEARRLTPTATDTSAPNPLASVRSDASLRPQNSMLAQGSLEPGELALTQSLRLLSQGRLKPDGGVLHAEPTQQADGGTGQLGPQPNAVAGQDDRDKQDPGRRQDSRCYQSKKHAQDRSVRSSPSQDRSASRSRSRSRGRRRQSNRSRGRSYSRGSSQQESRSRSRSRVSGRRNRGRSRSASSPSSSSSGRSYSRSRSRGPRAVTKSASHLSSRSPSPSNSGVAQQTQSRKPRQRSISPRVGNRHDRDRRSNYDRERDKRYDRYDSRRKDRDYSRDKDYSDGRKRDSEDSRDRYQGRPGDRDVRRRSRERSRDRQQGQAGRGRQDDQRRVGSKRLRSLSQDSGSKGSAGARRGAAPHRGTANGYNSSRKRARSRSRSRTSEHSRRRARRASRSPSSVSSADNAAHVSAAAGANASPPTHPHGAGTRSKQGPAGKSESAKAGAAPPASREASGSDMEIESEEGQAGHSPTRPTAEPSNQAAGRQGSREQHAPAGQDRWRNNRRHGYDKRDDYGGDPAMAKRRAEAGMAPVFSAQLTDDEVRAIESGTFTEHPTDLDAYRRKQKKVAGRDAAAPSAAAGRTSELANKAAKDSSHTGTRGKAGKDSTRQSSPESPAPLKKGSTQKPPTGTRGASGSGSGAAVAADEVGGNNRRSRPGSPSSSLRRSHADQQVSVRGNGSERPEVEDEPAQSVQASDMAVVLHGGAAEEPLRSKRAGPNEASAPPSDAMDDLPFLAFNMMKFSSSLFMGCAPEPCFGSGSYDPTSILNGSSSSGSGFVNQAAQRIGRPYRKDLIRQLVDEAREVKGKGDRMVKIAGNKWSALSLLKYLESSLMFMEAAYGYEQSADRERGTADAIKLLETLTQTTPSNGMLRCVEMHAQPLIKSKRAALRSMAEQVVKASEGQGLGEGQGQALQAAQAELVALQALSLLSQQLVAVALTKLLMLQKDSLLTAANALDPMGEGRGLVAAVGGTSGTAANKQPGKPSQGGRNPQGGGAGGAGGKGGGGGATGSSPPPADSASSTLEAASNLTSTNWMSSLSTLSTCMRQFATVGQLWQSAAAGTRKMYQETCVLAAGGYLPEAVAAAGNKGSASSTQSPKPSKAVVVADAGTASGDETAPPPTWTQQAHIAAAQLLSLGYEWGVWDVLGTITVARQVLDTLLQLPGVVS